MGAGVVVDGEIVDADVVVITMGPWSSQASAWLPIAKVTGQKANSIVLAPRDPVSAHMLSLSYHHKVKMSSPEVWSLNPAEKNRFRGSIEKMTKKRRCKKQGFDTEIR